MKKKALAIPLLIVLILALFMAACKPEEIGVTVIPAPEDSGSEDMDTGEEAPTGDSSEEEPEPEATIEVQDPIAAPILLDPALATDEGSLLVSSYLYETLVALDGEDVVPALALSWVISSDELSYTFTLRPDAVFHDGSALDADTVLLNFNRWFDPEHPLHLSGAYDAWLADFLGFKGELDDEGRPISNFDGIEKVNDYTVLIHLNEPDPYFLMKIAQVPFAIASTESLINGDVTFGSSAEFASGTGPYIIEEWTEEHILLMPNPDYWGDAPAMGLEFPLE